MTQNNLKIELCIAVYTVLVQLSIVNIANFFKTIFLITTNIKINISGIDSYSRGMEKNLGDYIVFSKRLNMHHN